MLAKSADHATNSQHQSNGGMLSGLATLVILSPPTSEVQGSNSGPFVGRLFVLTNGRQFTVQNFDQLYVLASSVDYLLFNILFKISFKTATLIYMFLHTGFPHYFATYLSSYNSFSTKHSLSAGNFFLVSSICSKDCETVWL